MNLMVPPPPPPQSYIRKQIQAIDADTSLDESERSRRKQVCPNYFLCVFSVYKIHSLHNIKGKTMDLLKSAINTTTTATP